MLTVDNRSQEDRAWALNQVIDSQIQEVHRKLSDMGWHQEHLRSIRNRLESPESQSMLSHLERIYGMEFPNGVLLSEIHLPPRVVNALRARSIWTIGQVLGVDSSVLLSVRNFGPKSFKQLKDALMQAGISLPDNWKEF